MRGVEGAAPYKIDMRCIVGENCVRPHFRRNDTVHQQNDTHNVTGSEMFGIFRRSDTVHQQNEKGKVGTN